MKYFSTKKFGPISTGHRQWRDSGHCRFMHGYGRYVEIIFSCSELDEKGWVVDFGGLKEVRKWLDDQWDHRMLISSDDPELQVLEDIHRRGLIDINIMDQSQGHGPGIEQSCKFVLDHVSKLVQRQSNGRCDVKSVRIWEHELNSAILEKDQDD